MLKNKQKTHFFTHHYKKASKKLAKNIENQIKKSFSAGAITDIGNIQVNTQIYSGSIEISFLSQDFENVCKCINHAIAYSNITPGMEDEIILQEKSIWQFTSSQLLFQLKYKFLSKFFEKKEYSHLFSCTLDILQDVSFNEIALLYTKILDASKMSIIITGNTETSDDELKNLAEKTFSIIPSLSENRNLQTKITRENDSSIDFKDTAVVVQVKRIFGSDIEAKDAGPRPEHLIPTTEFLDPAIVVLTSPSKTGEDYANFILALSVLQEKMKNDTSFQTLASDIQLFQFDEIDGVYGLAFFEVESSKKLYNYFKTFTDKKFSITENDLKNAKISYIGSTYGNLSTSEDNAKMMNENLSSTGNAFYHIDFLKSLKNAQLQNVQKSYETYIKGCPVYWIFTGDTKK